jgi:hypothetical protein
MEFLLPKMILPSLIEIDLLLLEKIFKKFHCIFTLLLLFPLGEGCFSSSENLNPLPQERFVPSLFKFGPVVL